MHQRVGLERDKRVDVIGGDNAHGRLTADLTGVEANLGWVAHADADEFKLWVAEHLGDNHLPDEAGSPHHNTLSHSQ